MHRGGYKWIWMRKTRSYWAQYESLVARNLLTFTHHLVLTNLTLACFSWMDYHWLEDESELEILSLRLQKKTVLVPFTSTKVKVRQFVIPSKRLMYKYSTPPDWTTIGGTKSTTTFGVDVSLSGVDRGEKVTVDSEDNRGYKVFGILGVCQWGVWGATSISSKRQNHESCLSINILFQIFVHNRSVFMSSSCVIHASIFRVLADFSVD